MKPALILVGALALGSAGCGTFLSDAMMALNEGSRIAGGIGRALDMADTGARLFFAGQPSPEAHRVTAAVQAARSALAAYDAAVRAGKDVEAAYGALREAYGQVREVIDATGVASGTRTGGAQGEGPEPAPVVLPTWEDLQGG